MDKTREQLQAELELRQTVERERAISDKKYAPIIIGYILITLLLGAAGTVITLIIEAVFNKLN